MHGDVQGSSKEFEHGLRRHGMLEDVNAIVPRIQEEHFFPFAQVSQKRSQPRSKHSPAPLIMEAVPPKVRIILPFQNRRRSRTEVKVPLPPVAKIPTKPKLSEIKRYKDIITLAQSELISFLSDILALPIPFLETIRTYYRNIETLAKEEKEKDNMRIKLARLASSGDEKEDIHREDKEVLTRKISEIEARLVGIRDDLRKIKIQSPSPKDLSLWILQSL